MTRPGQKRRRTADGGTAAVEFSIIAPILILMMACTFELGRALQSVSAVNKLASQYAIAWADCTDQPAGTCQTELGQYDAAASIANLAPQLAGSAVTLQMFQVTMNGTTPTVLYSCSTLGGVAGGAACPTAALNAAQVAAAQTVLTQSGQAGVIVTVNYTFQLAVFTKFLSSMIPSGIPMSYTIAQLKA